MCRSVTPLPAVDEAAADEPPAAEAAKPAPAEEAAPAPAAAEGVVEPLSDIEEAKKKRAERFGLPYEPPKPAAAPAAGGKGKGKGGGKAKKGGKGAGLSAEEQEKAKKVRTRSGRAFALPRLFLCLALFSSPLASLSYAAIVPSGELCRLPPAARRALRPTGTRGGQ